MPFVREASASWASLLLLYLSTIMVARSRADGGGLIRYLFVDRTVIWVQLEMNWCFTYSFGQYEIEYIRSYKENQSRDFHSYGKY